MSFSNKSSEIYISPIICIFYCIEKFTSPVVFWRSPTTTGGVFFVLVKPGVKKTAFFFEKSAKKKVKVKYFTFKAFKLPFYGKNWPIFRVFIFLFENNCCPTLKKMP